MVGVNNVDKLSMLDVELHPKSVAGSMLGAGLVDVFVPGIGLDVFINLAVSASN